MAYTSKVTINVPEKEVVGFVNGDVIFVKVAPMLLIHIYKAGVPATVCQRVDGFKYHHASCVQELNCVASFLKKRCGVDVLKNTSSSRWKPIYAGEFSYQLNLTA
jgi:hypothetical protein